MAILQFFILLYFPTIIINAKPFGNPTDAESISNSIDKYSCNLNLIITKSQKRENLLISPPSTYVGLSMLAYGTGGNTKKQLCQSLNLTYLSDQGFNSFHSFLKTLKKSANFNIILINRSMKIDIENHFDSITSPVDFNENQLTANTINQFFLRPKNIVESNQVDSSTSILMFNTLNFQGKWETPFISWLPMYFRVTSYTRRLVPSIHTEGTFKYGYVPVLESNVIELPFANGETRMLIIQPTNRNRLSRIERKIRALDIIDIVCRLEKKPTAVVMPRFKMTYKINLQEELIKMGMTEIFEKTGFFDQHVVQKVTLEVNDKGIGFQSEIPSLTKFPGNIVDQHLFAINSPFLGILRHENVDLFRFRISDLPNYNFN